MRENEWKVVRSAVGNHANTDKQVERGHATRLTVFERSTCRIHAIVDLWLVNRAQTKASFKRSGNACRPRGGQHAGQHAADSGARVSAQIGI